MNAVVEVRRFLLSRFPPASHSSTRTCPTSSESGEFPPVTAEETACRGTTRLPTSLRSSGTIPRLRGGEEAPTRPAGSCCALCTVRLDSFRVDAMRRAIHGNTVGHRKSSTCLEYAKPRGFCHGQLGRYATSRKFFLAACAASRRRVRRDRAGVWGGAHQS
jgi:hypothetical protein